MLQTEIEDQVAISGQGRDGQQQGLDSNYYDDGPSMMPASETFAGNQDNWGASAADGWIAGTTETSEWNAPNAVNTGTTSHW